MFWPLSPPIDVGGASLFFGELAIFIEHFLRISCQNTVGYGPVNLNLNKILKNGSLS